MGSTLVGGARWGTKQLHAAALSGSAPHIRDVQGVQVCPSACTPCYMVPVELPRNDMEPRAQPSSIPWDQLVDCSCNSVSFIVSSPDMTGHNERYETWLGNAAKLMQHDRQKGAALILFLLAARTR